MKLKSIRAYGFKSFADKMDLVFKTNITAIVGPNGSGKSNIVDAVRWVLGEQSVKSLRGKDSMSDVIFAGSETRAPFKRCEVALTFDNESHFLNTDLREVEIKRILYYTGENEYFINNTKVRLKDITNILLDSGMGSDSYNIISQGNIEAIVNSKPIDRRVILEGAAQVLKYKNRKTESLRKLEKTKDNLEKVDLVINELETTITPLKEQSMVAKKYLGFADELKNLEISLTVHDIDTIHEKYVLSTKRIDELTKEKEELQTHNLKKDSELEKLELKLLELENQIEEENNKLITLNEQLAKLNSEKTVLTERQKYVTSEEKIDANLLSLKEEENELNKQIALLKNEIKSLEAELNKIKNEIANLDEENSLVRVNYNKTVKEKESLIKKSLVLKNQINILENNIINEPGLSVAVKNVLNHPRLKGIHQTIGKLIEVEPNYSTAVDIALGASCNFIVVDNSSSAEKAISYLKENKLGRATFFPLDIIEPKNIPDTIINMVKKEKGFIGVASDLVSNDKKYDNIIKNQLGNVLVVENMSALEKIGHLLNYKYRIVTLDGELSHTGGSLTGGFLRKSTSVLQMKQELSTNKKELNDVEREIAKIEKKENEYYQTLLANENEIRSLLLSQNVNEESYNSKNNALKNLTNKITDLSSQIAGSNSLKTGSLEASILGIMKTINEIEILKETSEGKIRNLKNEKSEISSLISKIELENKRFSSTLYQIEQSLKEEEINIGKMDTKMDYLLSLLSEEYHITYEKAKMDYILEIEEDIARLKVTNLRKEIKSLGMVNLGSIEEYERLNTRYQFLKSQKDDLNRAIDDLLKIIDEMDSIMIERLSTAFAKIEKEFSIVFNKMFKGGRGKLILTDPDNILETGIEIVAEPPGKKLNNIQLLSGGEKTLTAISLLFAILNVYPVPFCILDEVEAALDEANVDTFGKYLISQKDKSEFILITHKKRTMEYADTLYGITMQEQGVSKVVSVKLEGKEADEK